MTLTAKDKQILTNQAEGIIHVVAPDKVQMEIIDVTHLYSQGRIDQIRDLYFEEKEDQRHKDDRSYYFKDSWVLVKNRYYVVKIYLFDQAENRIWFTKNQEFEFGFEKSYMNLIE